MSQWYLIAGLLLVIIVLAAAVFFIVWAGWALAVNLLAATMRPGRPYYHTRRWQVLRRYVLWRDRSRCQVCRRKQRVLDVHHVRPVSKGGSWYTSNLVAVDRACHARTHGRSVW